MFDLAVLEPRLLYCVDHALTPNLPADIGTFAAVYGPLLPPTGATTTGTTSTPLAGSVPTFGGVPVLASNPTATAKLYLDFDGAAATSWGSYAVPATPAYDQNGDATTFSDAEQAFIRDIWARVAEKYSPFNLDVTTVDPGAYPLGKVLRVVVGGGGAWSGGTYGGLSYVGSFTGGPNTSWVFSQNLGTGNPFYTAEAIAHESGHGFGLEHQSAYDANGAKTAEYNRGTAAVAPIMGTSYYATRGLWWYGSSTYGANSYQDDMARIAATSNGFGYRADDHGNALAAADALLASGASSVTASGVVEKTSDADYFKFVTGGGTVSLFANVASAGATLDLKLALYSSYGTLVASADTASLGESLSLDLAPGTYYLAVQSAGHYGDVGQYTITGSVPAPAGVLAAPSGLVASTAAAGQTSLTWQDNSADETGFVLQRSDDGGLTWYDLATVGANVTGYQDAAPTAGTQRHYRVAAFNATATSDVSNTVGVWGAPAAPSNVTATATSPTQVALTWAGVNGASGYVVHRSLDGVNWVQVAVTSGTTTAYQDTAVTGGTTYAYRVYASNGGGVSSFSAVAAVTTPVLTVPSAPSNLLAVQIAKGKVRLTWNDTSSNETGFRVEYSSNGTTWGLLVNVGANTTTYTATGLKKNATYTFRVRAYNAVGSSPYTAPAKASPAKSVAPVTTRLTPTGTLPLFSTAKVVWNAWDDGRTAGPLAFGSKGKRVFQAA